MPNLVDVEYQQSGKSLAIDALGMREMQRKAFEARASRYLLLKAPPASGKSRALMFLALDKLYNQGIKKVLVSVPERECGAREVVHGEQEPSVRSRTRHRGPTPVL